MIFVGPFIFSIRQSKIIINFNMNKIFIENESDNQYESMQICIFNNKNEEIVNHIVDECELLVAEELNRQVIDKI